jgi:hypothetical protein
LITELLHIREHTKEKYYYIYISNFRASMYDMKYVHVSSYRRSRSFDDECHLSESVSIYVLCSLKHAYIHHTDN